MRNFLVAGYVLIFALSAWVGYGLGQQSISQIPRVTPTDLEFPLPDTSETRQMNLLLVNVKQLKHSQPVLQAIWMVAFNPDTPIKLIPIYPSYPEDSTNDAELSKIFDLIKAGGLFGLDQATTLKLQERGLEWDGSIILDNRALAYFIDAFGPIKVGGETLDRDELASYKFPAFETRQLSMTYNTLLWREICWNILHSPEDILNLNSQFNKHIGVNFIEEVTGQDWVALLSNVKVPSCEFPMYFQAGN